MGRQCKIIAAQSQNAALFDAAINNSFEPIAVKTISSDGHDLGYRACCNKVVSFAQKFEHFNPVKSIIVKDLDVLNICTLFGDRHHILIEPLCGVAITALYKNKEYFKQFKNITIIVCGGNHIYYNKELLTKSIKSGAFNDEETNFDIFDSTKTYAEQPKDEEKKYDDDDDDEYDSQDIDSYDSQTEEM